MSPSDTPAVVEEEVSCGEVTLFIKLFMKLFKMFKIKADISVDEDLVKFKSQ